MKTALVFLPARLPHAPSLGPAVLASYLSEQGHEVHQLDYNLTIYRAIPQEHRYLWDMEVSHLWNDLSIYRSDIEPLIKQYFKKLVMELILLEVEAVGFTVLNVNYYPALTVIKILRTLAPDIKIFYGGPNITRNNAIHDLELDRVDAAVIGEGEKSCDELLKMWDRGEKEILHGVISKSFSHSILEGPARKLLNMKELPMPSFDCFDLNKYQANYLPIEFGRGCIAKCTFCSETNYWVSFRTKSAEQIFKTIEYYVTKLKIFEFRIVDSLMNGNHMLLEDLCTKIIEANLKIRWFGFMRIDLKLTNKLLGKMKKAGCISVTYGIESGSQKVLNLMRKDYKIAEIYQVIKDTHSSGIGAHTQILIGFPGENFYNFGETIWLLWKLRHYFEQIYPGNPLTITPNTHIIDNLNLYKIAPAKSRGGHWRTKWFTNTIYHRKFKYWILIKFLGLINLSEGYPSHHAIGPELDHVGGKPD